jgi:drug/metabolite transporter (DMT)-like permease
MAALVAAGIPLWVALFERLAPDGTRLTSMRAVGLLVGFAGVVVLLAGDELTLRGGPRLLAVAVASMASALGMVILRRAPLPSNAALSSAMTMLAGGALALVVGWAGGENRGFALDRVSALSLAAYGYLILFGSVLAFTCFTWLARTVSPSRASTHAYVNPLVALLLGAGLGGEELTLRALAATPLILGGLMLVLGSRQTCVSSPKLRSLPPREPASRSGDQRAALPLARCDRAGAG